MLFCAHVRRERIKHLQPLVVAEASRGNDSDSTYFKEYVKLTNLYDSKAAEERERREARQAEQMSGKVLDASQIRM